MATKITDTAMTSDQTRHTATMDAAGNWSVTWLPGRALTRTQAITAMTIAVVIAVTDLDVEFGRSPAGSLWWGHMDNWAAELGISGPHAVAEASLSPEEHAAGVEQADAGDRVNARLVAEAGLRQDGPAVVARFRRAAVLAEKDGRRVRDSFLMYAEEAEKLLQERAAGAEQEGENR